MGRDFILNQERYFDKLLRFSILFESFSMQDYGPK